MLNALASMNIYMFSGPVLLLVAVPVLAFTARYGGFAFWRFRAFGDAVLPLVAIGLLAGGLSVTGAGFAPTIREQFTVSDTNYQSKTRNYTVWTTDGREISVPSEVGRGLLPGDSWQCSIRQVPITHQLLGDCFDGRPA